MSLKKPLVIATVAAAVAMGTLSTKASAGDPILGALIGGGIGAAIGHNSHSRHGTAVGGVLGAIVGSSIASTHGGYYDRGYYDSGYGYGYAPRTYYAPAPVYAAPVYGTSIVYSSGPSYRYGPRHYSRHDRRDYRRGDRHWR
jgi:hypothetical protein